MIPSIYLKKSKLSNTILFYISLLVGKERSDTFGGIKRIVQARIIVNAFWRKKLQEEKKFLADLINK